MTMRSDREADMTHDQHEHAHHHDDHRHHETRPTEPARAPAQPPSGEGVVYTCPMHPQIRQIGPGNCPICGMTLEPETPAVETGPSPELIDMQRRFRIGLLLALPVLA